MPTLAPKPCGHSGCRNLVRDGSTRCETHKEKKKSNFSRQLSSTERGYGYAWQKLRLVILRRDGGICQACKALGKLTAGNIVDHIKPKEEGGSDDLDNLQAICKPCHTMKTAKESARGGQYVKFEPEWLPASLIPVSVVCGPPGSGKSTYVKERAGSCDLVLDADVIAAEMFKLPLYHASLEQIIAAIRYRNKMLAGLAEPGCGFGKAWLIVTANTYSKREFWKRKYDNLTVMNTPKPECIERVRNDTRRPENRKNQVVNAILEWS